MNVFHIAAKNRIFPLRISRLVVAVTVAQKMIRSRFIAEKS